ncbi:MAG: hypothetical protein ACI8QF_002855 [Limisphaerales bacterium]|jgi:hypothetical protein
MSTDDYNIVNPDASDDKAAHADEFDIFICGGDQHLAGLERLLPRLHPHGRVHLAAITLSESSLDRLRANYDVLHRPRFCENGYNNFARFCVEDINRLASARHFIKLDADICLESKWIDYARMAVMRRPDAALLGPFVGVSPLNLRIDGPEIHRRFGAAISAVGKLKIRGGFYIGRTEVFKSIAADMSVIHRTIRDFLDGVGNAMVKGPLHSLPDHAPEDVIRSLALHVTGNGDRIVEARCAGEIRLSASETRPLLESAR